LFIRVLFLLLLALNIGAACWLYFTPRESAGELPAADPGVPKLVLLSENDPVAGNAEMASPAETRADLKQDVCVSIGPFTTQADMRAAMNALTPQVARIQFREQRTTEVRGYWVYLPAPPSREKALAMARQLSGKGLSDYYIVTVGDQPNAISLGLFRDQGNAEKRKAEVQALGFEPQITQRSDEVPAYWLDFAQNGRDPVDWRARLPANAELQQKKIECF